MTTTEIDLAEELATFRRTVREEIIRAGQNRSDYTREQQNATLTELGLDPIYPPIHVPIEVTTAKRTTVRIDDCPDMESALAKVAAMGEAEIVAKLRAPGGYLSHRMLDPGEVDPDPLSWIIAERESTGPNGNRAVEAVEALRVERAEGRRCRANSPTGQYTCSRGVDHPGQHMAAASSYICSGSEGIWVRGTSYPGSAD